MILHSGKPLNGLEVDFASIIGIYSDIEHHEWTTSLFFTPEASPIVQLERGPEDSHYRKFRDVILVEQMELAAILSQMHWAIENSE